MDPVVGTPKIQDDLVADDFCMFGLLQFFLLDGKDYERFALDLLIFVMPSTQKSMAMITASVMLEDGHHHGHRASIHRDSSLELLDHHVP